MKQRIKDQSEVTHDFAYKNERIAVLEIIGIKLSVEERSAVVGTQSELRAYIWKSGQRSHGLRLACDKGYSESQSEYSVMITALTSIHRANAKTMIGQQQIPFQTI